MLNNYPDNNFLTYLLMAFVAMTGLSYINFLPGVVSALAGAIGFSEIEAGQIVALNGYGGLLGSTVAIFMVRLIRWQPAIFIGLAVLLVVDIGSALVDDYQSMLVWRFVAGVSGGFSLGVAFAVLARMNNPDRAFGSLLFVQFSVGALVIYVLPGIEGAIGAHAVFYVMSALGVLSLLFVVYLAGMPLKQASGRNVGLLPRAYRHIFKLLLATLFYQVAASAIWAYVGLIGLAAGIEAEPVSAYIAVTGLLGLFGAMLPVITGKRYGRLGWLLAGVALSMLAAVLLSLSGSNVLYVLAMAVLFFSWPAVQSYLLAVIAELDGSGRFATVAAVISLLGLATGPLLAAGLLVLGDYPFMLFACAVMFLLSGLFLVGPVRTQELSGVAVVSSEYR